MALGVKVHSVVQENQPPLFACLGVFERIFRAVQRYWNSIQVGHRGRYSVERLLAFQEYYQRTSPARAFVVCFLALLPSFFVATLIEFIPLAPPHAGWKANYPFWIRLLATSLSISTGGVYQVTEVIDPGTMSASGIVVTAVGSGAFNVAITIALAALWAFPVPFGYVLTVGPFIGSYMVLFVLCVGPRVLATSPNLRRQIFLQMLVVAAQGTLAIAYPAYGAIFNQLSTVGQSVFIFVLPVIKFSIKQFVAKASAHLHEYVGPTVVLSVDVCNVLYVAICVQTAASPITSGLLIACDAFFVLLALRSIYYQSDVRQARQRLLSMNSKLPTTLSYIRNLRALLRDAFHSPEPSRVPIRTRAPFPLSLSDESKAFLQELESVRRRYSVQSDLGKEVFVESMIIGKKTRGPSTRIDSSDKRDLSGATISYTASSGHNSHLHVQPPSVQRIGVSSTFDRPLLLQKMTGSSSTLNGFIYSKRSRTSATASRAETYHHQTVVGDVQDSLQALFHSEYVVLGEFIECVIPMLYGVYLAVLYHLPTAQYYPNVRTLTPERFASTELNIMLYAAVEFSSFIGINLLLQRKFGFSPLYQLAFVCETQARTLQSYLFVWIMFILPITLDHNGVDFEAPFK